MPKSNGGNNQDELFNEQVSRLTEAHFLALLWATLSEGSSLKYNITNCFDDFKHIRLTRTKQTAVAIVEGLSLLRFIDVKDEKNRKNIYITRHGARALAQLLQTNRFEKKPSNYIEEQKQES